MNTPNKQLNFPHYRTTENGKTVYLNTADNLRELLAFAGYEAKHNQMNLEFEVFKDGESIGNFDQVRSDLISLSSIYGLPKSAIDDHYNSVALSNPYHPVRDLLSGKWDGIKRLDPVIDCLQSEFLELTRIVLKRWFVGCIASLFISGFKSKLVPVLQGDQSFKKTAFIERIAKLTIGAFLEGAELNPDQKDSVLSVIKAWIVELGELERSTKNCQGSMKAFISRDMDTIRPPYARTDIKKPRQTNIIATVNRTDFLKDETGNSRYAVIRLTAPTDMDTLNRLLGWEYLPTGELVMVDKEQLIQFWLEAKYLLFEEKFGWMLTGDEIELVKQQSEQFVDKGNWYAVIEDHLSNCNGKGKQWMTATQICSLMNIDKSKSNAVGKALGLHAAEKNIEKKVLNGSSQYLFPSVLDMNF
jgi:predicted P-loop ATPase